MAMNDVLVRQIEQMGAALRRMLSLALGLPEPGTEAAGPAQLRQDLCALLKLPEDALPTMAPAQLVEHVQQDRAANEANLDLLADVLMAMADDPGNDPGQAAHFRRQALAILERLNAASPNFSLERHGKVARLRALR